MSSFYEGIMEGLVEALAYAKGELNGSPDFIGCAPEKEPELGKTESEAEQGKTLSSE